MLGKGLYFPRVNIEQLNMNGRKIKLIVEDHQYQVPRAVQVANKLINRDKVFAMIGALGTPMNNAVMKQQLAKDVPNLFPYTAARSMHEPYHKLKIGALSSYYHSTRKAVGHFVKVEGTKKVCLMAQDSDYGQEIEEAVMDELKAQNISLTAKALHKPTDISFDVSVSKLKDKGCELVVMGTIIKDTIQILATSKKKGFTPKFLGTLASYDPIVGQVKGGLTEGYYVAAPFIVQYPDTKLPGAQAFFKKYQAKYGKVPGSAAQLGYTYAEVFVKALEKTGKDLTLDNFMTSLRSLDKVELDFMEKPVNFDPTRKIEEDQIYLSQVKSGKWTKVKPL